MHPESRLRKIGYDEARRVEAETYLAAIEEDDEAGEGDRTVGRVGRVDRGEVVVITEDGALRAMSDSQRAQSVVAPVTGDWVVVRDDAELGLVIDTIFERRTAIVRRDPAEGIANQVLVSNIDRVAVVHGLDQDQNDARIERFLVLAIDSGADPLIILTKSDLDPGDSEMSWLESIAPVVTTSSVLHSGIEDLRTHIGEGETLVFIGPSGVGKSTLVNELVGDDIVETADVREVDRRGRHTTTVRELIELPSGGVVIDTPGIRAIGLWAADIALDEVFADLAELAVDCRFRDCTHRSEPGCAVTAAVEAGDVDEFRVARYQLLWQELAEQAIELERRNRAPQHVRRNRRRR